jgi:hypothetical protein
MVKLGLFSASSDAHRPRGSRVFTAENAHRPRRHRGLTPAAHQLCMSRGFHGVIEVKGDRCGVGGRYGLGGSPRIGDEMAKLGREVSTATIRKYRPKSRRRPSQGWRTFFQNHTGAIAAMDFFVVPTVTFRWLYVLIVITHERRKVVHGNITDSPTAAWTAQQIVNAFPYNTAPKHLLRDRDSIYGSVFVRRVEGIRGRC